MFDKNTVTMELALSRSSQKDSQVLQTDSINQAMQIKGLEQSQAKVIGY